nr:vegetative cell wall protein gp1-like [Crassostrea gigas]
MNTTVSVSHSYPRLFTRQVIELWDYQWNPVRQQYERVCFRPLHLFKDEANPQDPSDGEFYRPSPIMVSELPENVQRRMVPDARNPRTAIVPPARPPPPNIASPRQAIIAVPVTRPAVIESPASPDPSEPYSPTDTPTKRTTPSPPPFSPNRLHCDRSYFVARQDHQQVIELWDYQWNPVRQQYERVCFRPLHLFKDEANPQDPSDGEFYRPSPIMVSELPENVQRRMVPDARNPRTAIVPPARPPPPNIASPRQAIIAVPVTRPAVIESPASPDPSEPYSPTDTPTKRTTPSPPPFSPNRLHCDRSYFVARQDHQFALPVACPDNPPARPAGPFSPVNPPLQPAPQPQRTPIRRRAPSPPKL